MNTGLRALVWTLGVTLMPMMPMMPLVAAPPAPTASSASSAPETPAAASAPTGAFVARLAIDAPIGPATSEYYHDASQRAVADGARAIVLQMDTPGGLSEAMRAIIADILASPIPVLGYVAPSGARAASAGTYILYACHIAAMAPATHLGAATPVSLGGSTPMPMPTPDVPGLSKPDKEKAEKPDSSGDAEAHKVLNDAIAYIRSLAQLRHRNVDWAESAVRGAATLTASEAADKQVIDFVATDVQALLAQADGRTVKVGETMQTLHLKGLPVRDYAPGWRTRFLSVITNPTIAYVLLLVGIYGLVLEAFHPGAMLPGIVGGISLLVGAYALQLLPVNYAGLALMVLGIGMVIGEALIPSVGALGIGGVVAFVLGSVMLMNTGVPGYTVNLGVIIGLATVAAGVLLVILWAVMRSRRGRPVIGDDGEMLGLPGEVLTAIPVDGEGWVMVRGERWRASAKLALPMGASVRVVSRQGLILWVESKA